MKAREPRRFSRRQLLKTAWFATYGIPLGIMVDGFRKHDSATDRVRVEVSHPSPQELSDAENVKKAVGSASRILESQGKDIPIELKELNTSSQNVLDQQKKYEEAFHKDKDINRAGTQMVIGAGGLMFRHFVPTFATRIFKLVKGPRPVQAEPTVTSR